MRIFTRHPAPFRDTEFADDEPAVEPLAVSHTVYLAPDDGDWELQIRESQGRLVVMVNSTLELGSDPAIVGVFPMSGNSFTFVKRCDHE